MQGEVNEVASLIHEFAATRQRARGSPFALVAEPSAMAIASAQPQQPAMFTAVDDGLGLRNRRMKSMVEPDRGNESGALRGLLNEPKFVGVPPARLLNEDVLAVRQRRDCEFREMIVRCRNNHDVDVVAR